MQSEVAIDVSAIDPLHRRALEEVMGRGLLPNERLVISVIDVPPSGGAVPSPTLPAYCNVFDGLSDTEIADLESSILARSPSRGSR
jgi:hypothetical protein